MEKEFCCSFLRNFVNNQSKCLIKRPQNNPTAQFDTTLTQSLNFKTVNYERVTCSHQFSNKSGSIYVFGKLPTYPSPKPTLSFTSHLRQNVGLGEGWVGSFQETSIFQLPRTLSNYMMWTLVRYFVPYLSRDYREALLEYDKEIQGTKTAKPRWLHCIEELNSYYHGLTFAVGYMWIKNVFDKDIIPFVSIPCRC